MNDVFADMPEPIKKAIASAGFTEPTPIQARAIPLVAAGKDVLGIAQTGTGKTAAFVLPMLQRMLLDPKQGIRTLILCPTRELAAQVDESINLFTKQTNIRHVAVFGGVAQGPQVSALKKGVNIIVATPGRLMDLYDQSHVNLRNIEFFVLDEADRMLDMGFIHDIKKISALIPKTRQTLFFSATMSKDVAQLANTLLHDPTRVEVAPQSTPVDKVEHHVLFVDGENKTELLLHLLSQKHLQKVLVFTKTKRGADRICRVLKKNGVSAHQIHSDRTQSQRTQALKAFTHGTVRCLVATDVAARGIDIDDISHVINYDLPMEAENYVHRIGRTARAGAKGTAYSFCTADDKGLLKEIHKSIGQELPIFEHKFHSEKAKESRMTGKPPRGKSPSPRGKSGGRFGPSTFVKSKASSGERRGSARGSPKGKFGSNRPRDEKKPFARKSSVSSSDTRRNDRSDDRRGSKNRSGSGFSKKTSFTEDRRGRSKGGSSKIGGFASKRFSRDDQRSSSSEKGKSYSRDNSSDDNSPPHKKRGGEYTRAAPKRKSMSKGSRSFKQKHGRTPSGGKRR